MRTKVLAIPFVLILGFSLGWVGCGAVRQNIDNFQVSQEDFAVTAGTDENNLTVGVTGAALETETFKVHAGFCIKTSEVTRATDQAGGFGAIFKRLVGCN